MGDEKPMGFATVQVLHAVGDGAEYGFDVCDRTGLPSGTVYPALSKLETSGFVRSRWEDHAVAQREKRPPRRYYQVTAQGHKALDAALRRFRALEPLSAGGAGARKPAKARG